jgi:thiol-disulfide isomerase/thioredoxin
MGLVDDNKKMYSENSNYIIKLNYTDLFKKGDYIRIKKNKKTKNCSNKLGFLKIYAQWCQHCHSIENEIKFISNELNQNKFCVFVLDCAEIPPDENQKFLDMMGISGYPSFFMVNNYKLEQVDINNREIDGFLLKISQKALDYCNQK